MHDKFIVSLDIELHEKKIKTITENFSEILLISYFYDFWACLEKPDQTHLKWHDQFEVQIDVHQNVKN